MTGGVQAVLLALVLLVQPPAAAVDSAALDRLTREVSQELRCPVCQGESIQESPAELAQEMKGVVREQLAAGRTPDEVKAYFVGRYGEWILLRPTTTGVNLMLYWLPPIVMIAGGAVVVLLARRWIRASRLATPTPSPTPDDA
ncbi:MAG: cytochrome c-type biogenesis protein CcmH [Gemmatimonadaceae bacterium]|nr:cytochrome c-type biogenesis protein CcmH [Gemmatimonadaceae bacterium]